MKCFALLLPALLFFSVSEPKAQAAPRTPKGKLFIIGGGNRTPLLMRSLVKTASLSANDYVVVLPMSSEQPDSSFHYFKQDWVTVSGQPLVNFNFTRNNINHRPWLDSLERAKLVFI
ncbi:MAG: hypothetical protein JNM68_12340, partial [Dinghuibacter sp.]|nr:hypothetical protein [Dinghuibacter sp.]